MGYGDNLTYGKKHVNPDGIQKIYIGTTTGRYNGKSLLEKQLENLNLPQTTITAASLDQAFDSWLKPEYHEHTIAALNYWRNDVELTKKCYADAKTIIKKVIFNNPATIVLWGDGSKTVVKCGDEGFDPEKGLAMAIAKHFLGTNKSKSNYYKVFEEWLPKEEEEDITIVANAVSDAIHNVAKLFRKGTDENGAEDNN